MVAVTGMSAERRTQFEDVIAHQDLGDVFPYFEQFPELRPASYSRDVFTPDGLPRHAVRLPANFEPKLILEDEVWGFATLPVGDSALARASW